MANYLLTYYGGSGMAQSDDERAKVMADWQAWFGQLGDALVDGGNPTTQSRAVSPDGSVMDATMAPTGYSIIKANSLDEAVKAAQMSPVLAGGSTVVVSETFAAM